MMRYLEMYYLDVIKGNRKGFFANFLRGLLWLFSWPYQACIIARNWAFNHGWLRRYYPPVPVVISIGNIVMGGTGKTPVTLKIAQEFYKDFEIAILTRGYRSKSEKLPAPIVLCKGQGPMHPAEFCGDEPYLLAQNLPKALLVVGKDRHKSSNMAAKAGAEMILLDDGMQHRRLARDFEVIVLDANDPFGTGYFIPRGLLRESPQSLARANLIVLNHIRDNEHFIATRQNVEKYTQAPIIGTKMEVLHIWDTNGQKIESLNNKKVALFCALANPSNFLETVQNLQAQIVNTSFIADHRPFSKEELQLFAKKSQELGAEFLLCTEKDRVKLAPSLETTPPIAWLQMQLNIVEGKNHWQHFINQSKQMMMQRR